MKIWLDDVRPAPPGWTWLRTVDETVHMLAQGNVEELSLDYHLTHSDPDRYGVEVLNHLYNLGRSEELPVVHIHSSNPFGAAHLSLVLRAIEGRCEPNPDTLYELLDMEQR